MVLTSKVLGYYNLDSDINDVVNEYNLSSYNISHLAGHINTAASFNGSTSYAEKTSASEFEVSTFSIRFWIKPTPSVNCQYIISFGRAISSPYVGYHIILNASNQLNIFTGTASSYNNVTTSGTITDNVWTHVVVTFNGTQIKVYFNAGTPETFSGLSAIGYNSSYRTMSFGRLADYPDYYYYGLLDEVCVWGDKVLTASEITTDYNSSVGMTYPFDNIYLDAILSGSGNWSVPVGVTSVKVLVVAGGAGGGWQIGGGGGAGGYIYNSSYIVTSGGTVSYSIGSGGNGGTDVTTDATNGGNSVFGSLTAIGGGFGGVNAYRPAGSGGSGGGSGEVGYSQGTGTVGQGNNGGYLNGSGSGGGGGAGAVGSNGSGTSGGAGGIGVDYSSIFGTEYGELGYFAGGGGGGSYTGGTPGLGGLGGGGDAISGSNGQDGATNTGGGGAGGDYKGTNRNGGNGGSGIILIVYEAPLSATDNSILHGTNI